MKSFFNGFQKLSWKLTLRFMVVTVGSLLVLGLIAGGAVFSKILVPDLWITPEMWMEAANRSAIPILRNLLSQEPVDGELVSIWLDEIDMMLSSDELFTVGDAQFFISTAVDMDVMVIDEKGDFLGSYNAGYLPDVRVGAPFDVSSIPGLGEPYQAAMAGETDPQKLFTIMEPDEEYVIAIPIMSEGQGGEVLGVIVGDIHSVPTQRDSTMLTLQLIARISLYFLFGAAIVGAIFGSITARGMSRRFQRLADQADAWSEGNFSEFIEDSSGDEIGQLGHRLNRMAEQLKDFLKRRQEMAVSEERNRLARDLHDSAKQQALAASFQIGTALTLYDREPDVAKGHLEEADRLVDSVREELTDLILELRPQALQEKSIDEILGEYALDWAHQHEIELHHDLQSGIDLNSDQKQTLLRILQEALANVARHSHGSCVSLTLGSDGGRISLTVEDDGKGFSPKDVTTGMGLYSMRERAESLGGSLEVTSASGEGTSLSVVFPDE